MFPQILITPGEPAGIGPDITIQIAQHDWPAEIIVVADPELLQQRAKQLGLEFNLKVIPVALQAACEPGKLNVKNASYVIECLRTATDYCLQKKAHALVTGPVQKSILNDAGIAFSGHTEFLAAQCRAEQPLMLFVVNQLKVALATIHMPLIKVPSAITRDHLTKVLRTLHKELMQKFGIRQPKILVCGLNPHAGEQGHLGTEELNIIEPVIKALKGEGMQVLGPFSADTIFTEKVYGKADAILAMFHDQALPVVKSLGFGQAVNVTLGLPIIRTSVDHGTALDMAGSGKADPSSMMAAVQLAIKLIPHT